MLSSIPFRLLKVGHCVHPECIAIRGGRWKAVEFPALVGLFVHPALGPILYDTGYSEHFLHATQRLPERAYRWITPHALPDHEALPNQLERLGMNAAEVKLVLISHFHADHIAGLRDFPNADFLAMRSDWISVSRMGRIGGLVHAFIPSLLPEDFSSRIRFAEDLAAVSLPAFLHPFTGGFDLLGDRSIIGVPLPGHSRSQMGLLFQDETGRPFFLVADTCWTVDACTGDHPPTWLASLVMADRPQYLDTFSRLRTVALREPDLAIVPSHCARSWRSHGHAYV